MDLNCTMYKHVTTNNISSFRNFIQKALAVLQNKIYLKTCVQVFARGLCQNTLVYLNMLIFLIMPLTITFIHL